MVSVFGARAPVRMREENEYERNYHGRILCRRADRDRWDRDRLVTS